MKSVLRKVMWKPWRARSCASFNMVLTWPCAGQGKMADVEVVVVHLSLADVADPALVVVPALACNIFQ